jgi:hypothetical protein
MEKLGELGVGHAKNFLRLVDVIVANAKNELWFP